MAFDTSMYSQIKPVEIPNPLAQAAQIAQLQGAQNQNRLADLVFGEKQREVADQAAIRQALSGANGDAKAASAALMGKGFYKQALEIEKAQTERDKSLAAMDKDRIEAARKKLELAGQAFGYVRNNPTLEAAHSVLDYLGQNGIYTPQQVSQYKQLTATDPTKIKALADQAYMSVLAADKQLPTYQTRNTGGTTDTLAINPVTGDVKVAGSVQNTQSPDSVASVAEQRRAHNMVDARSREQIAATAGKPPAGYRWSADGSKLEAIPGGPGEKDKAPTEFQGKSAAFGARAEAADKIISDLAGEYSPAAVNAKQAAGKVWGVGGALEAGANLALSASAQKAEQAQRDFVNAVLRQESGAAISESEFNNAKKQYFPQPGDSEAVIAQKAANRKLAIKGFQSNAGKAALKPGAGISTLPQGWSVQEH